MARKVLSRDMDGVAEFIVDEHRRRKGARSDDERIWKEIDRQVAMDAKGQQARDAQDTSADWMPQIEMPNQAWTLEVLAADTRRLVFGRGEDWYTPHAMFDDELGAKIRETSVIHGDEFGIPVGVDNQEFVDLSVKATIDSYHNLYNYRAAWDALFIEGLKYGNYAGRMMLQDLAVFGNDYRGVTDRKIPMLVPVSIKNLYCDDSAQHVLHEGMQIQPSYIRTYWQKVADIKRASASGKNGWISSAVGQLDEKDVDATKGQIEMLEMEGDIVIPRSQGKNVFLSNRVVTVAVTGGPKVLRVREQKFKFRSYITGTYQRDDIDKPIGTSPIVKARTLQNWASESANRTAQTAALNADPTIVYDESDSQLAAQGGPRNEPGASFASDNPNAIRKLEQGDPGAMFAVFQGVQSLYEQLTGVNDPRRGAGPKSHTTLGAEEINLSRSVLRTEDYVDDIMAGSLKNALYMEWDMIRSIVGVKRPVLVRGEGINIHIDVSKDILPEVVDFDVAGALGVLTSREKRDNFLAAMGQAAQIEPMRVQLGMKPMNWDAILEEMFSLHEVQNANRFFPTGESAPEPDEEGGDVPPGLEEIVGGLA